MPIVINKRRLIFIIYLSIYTAAFRIRDGQDSLDYNDEIKNDIAEEIDYEKSRNILTKDTMQDDFIDTEEEKRSVTKTIQKRDLRNNNNQFLYNVQGNKHSVYNQNGNDLEWYSCSTGLIVQLRRTGLNSTTNTNNSSGYNSIYNHFVQNLNSTNNFYNIKNNTIIKGYYGTYKVVRAYKPKNGTNTNKITNNPKNNKMNDTATNNLLNNDGNKVNSTYNHLNNKEHKNNIQCNLTSNNEIKNNITYNHLSNKENKNNLANNPDDTVTKKCIKDSCSIISSTSCPRGFHKSAGYCTPDPENYVESEDYQDYDFDVTYE